MVADALADARMWARRTMGPIDPWSRSLNGRGTAASDPTTSLTQRERTPESGHSARYMGQSSTLHMVRNLRL